MDCVTCSTSTSTSTSTNLTCPVEKSLQEAEAEAWLYTELMAPTSANARHNIGSYLVRRRTSINLGTTPLGALAGLGPAGVNGTGNGTASYAGDAISEEGDASRDPGEAENDPASDKSDRRTTNNGSRDSFIGECRK